MARVPRWVLGVAAAALVVVAVDAVVIVLARDGTAAADARPARGRDAVAMIDPRRHEVLSTIEVGRGPTAVAAGYGGAWIVNRIESTLTHVDAATRAVDATMTPGTAATDVTVGAGGVWFVGHPVSDVATPLETAELERIDPATHAVDRSFHTRTGATALAAGAGAIWSTGYLGGHVRGAARSDARTGAMSRLDIGIYGDLLTADDEAVYYVASISNRVARVAARTGLLTDSMTLVSDASLAAGNVPASPTAVAFGGGSLWISESDGGVLRVDSRLRGIRDHVQACHNALGLAYGEGGVWVACGDNTVVRIDPATDDVGQPIAVDGLPAGIAAGAGAVWVTLER
jgi:hypothetical protein